MSSPLTLSPACQAASDALYTLATAPDRSALLASLTVTGKASTPHGFAWRSTASTAGDRPFACTPHVGITTWHASPALAVARLVSL